MVSELVLPPCEVEVTFECGETGVTLGDSGCGTFSRLIIMGNVAGRAASVSWSPATKALERTEAVVASQHQVAVVSVRVGRQDVTRPYPSGTAGQPFDGAFLNTAPSLSDHREPADNSNCLDNYFCRLHPGAVLDLAVIAVP
ncbi:MULTISPECIES: hypothetical protein [unclassified Streptomyces]|uniref:hypothetical protein n=1 Tax=unclassified Streptomyces TaxID=2593676 RepID=UPI002E35A52D|nr:hypothetical protein [Streptomyces sp. NBC_01462]